MQMLFTPLKQKVSEFNTWYILRLSSMSRDPEDRIGCIQK